jgi:extracellular factor (EF) 3-hydroxypalmitic acid methyl ester biosynthesis protein
VQKIIDSFFLEQVPQFTQTLERLQQQADSADDDTHKRLTIDLTQSINQSLEQCAALEQQLEDYPKLLKAVQLRYRETIWPWFGTSWFMCRALNKPRGYPGDFELLTAIYSGEARSPGLGGCLDRYFLQTTLAKAVVARMESVRSFLIDEIDRRHGDIHVLNVAAGACREYENGFEPPADVRFRLTCIDNDPLALEFVKKQVAPRCSSRIGWEFTRYNALRMTSVRHSHEKFGRPDVLYSVGLCDYIPDNYLVPMLRAWRETIGDGGAVYVAFKDGDRYSKTEYQWLTDWYFYQRSAAECTSLFTAAGYELEDLLCRRDATGVILNFVSRSRVPAQVRVDAAEAMPKAPQVAPEVTPAETQTLGGR